MDDLRSKKCVPCEGNFPPLTREQAQDLMGQIPGWELSEDAKAISRKFLFTNFAESMAFANKIAEIAEEEDHHPDMLVSWGKVVATLSTHSIRGLSENDFIVAAKINDLQ